MSAIKIEFKITSKFIYSIQTCRKTLLVENEYIDKIFMENP